MTHAESLLVHLQRQGWKPGVVDIIRLHDVEALLQQSDWFHWSKQNPLVERWPDGRFTYLTPRRINLRLFPSRTPWDLQTIHDVILAECRLHDWRLIHRVTAVRASHLGLVPPAYSVFVEAASTALYDSRGP